MSCTLNRTIINLFEGTNIFEPNRDLSNTCYFGRSFFIDSTSFVCYVENPTIETVSDIELIFDYSHDF